MKKIAMFCAALAAIVLLTSAKKKDNNIMTKENGVYIVNTTELGKDVKGYIDATPLKVYISKNKIQKACAKHMLNKWDGMKVSEAKTAEVDGRTGATFSSDAVKKNVKLALEYYEKNK